MSVSLVALRAFEAAARHLSFKDAAEELNLSATAISHQIRALEKSLQHQLFHRQVRKVVLTKHGEALGRQLTPAFQTINTAVAELRNIRDRHTVTLGAGPIFGARWLAPKLGQFWKQHPDIDLRLHHSPLPAHQQMARYDMAVAWGDNQWQGLEAIRLLDVHVSPVYAPGAEFSLNSRSDPRKLLQYPLLHHRDHSGWQLWFKKMGIEDNPKLPGIVFEDANVQLQAALEGQGVTLGFLPLISDEIAAGRLIQPWKKSIKPAESYYLIYQQNSIVRGAVRQVRDWLLANARH